MVDPHEEISYLVRSENRVRVLETLSVEPMSKRAVVDRTGISGVTAGRIIDGFLTRGWIDREGDDTYGTTPVGELIAEDYRRLSDSMDLACRLGPVIEHVPLDDMDFDVRHLTDAAVSDPQTFDPLRAMDRQMQLFREAEHVRAFTYRVPNFLGEVIYQQVIDGTLRLEVVYEAHLVDRMLESPGLRQKTVQAIRAGAAIYRAADDLSIPHHAGTFDDLVAIAVHDDVGSMCMGIETRSEPIHRWVVETFEAYLENASRVTVDHLEH